MIEWNNLKKSNFSEEKINGCREKAKGKRLNFYINIFWVGKEKEFLRMKEEGIGGERK